MKVIGCIVDAQDTVFIELIVGKNDLASVLVGEFMFISRVLETVQSC